MHSKFYMKSISSFQTIYNFAHLFPSAQKVAIFLKILRMKVLQKNAHTEEIVEHPPSVRADKLDILLCYIFVYYVNSIHTGLFGSRKPGGGNGPIYKILKHVSSRL